MKRPTFCLFAFLTLAGLAVPAFAKEGDEEACTGKAEGDDCTRADGSEGTCLPDESDPEVLTCDDDADGSGGSGSGSGGCSTGGSGPVSPWGAAPIALGLLALRRRRAR